jgi:hypothetical protein
LNETSITKSTPPKPLRQWDFWDYGLLFLLILGLIGNSLTILVMRSKRMRHSNAVKFITVMAISDIILLLIKFIANIQKLYKLPVYNFCLLIQAVPQAAAFISVWLIILTTIERMIAVTRPLKVTQIFSSKRCKIIISLMIIAFSLLSSTLMLCIHYSPQMPYYCRIRGTIEGNCFIYYNYIFPWFRLLLGSLIPSIICITLNIIIITFLYRALINRKNITTSNKQQQHQQQEEESTEMITTRTNTRLRRFSSSHPQQQQQQQQSTMPSKERQITIMLVCISVSFVILTLPYGIVEILRHHKSRGSSNLKISRKMLRACMFLLDINHATNFILYCLTAQRFRNELSIISLQFLAKITPATCFGVNISEHISTRLNQKTNKSVKQQKKKCLSAPSTTDK